MLDLYRPSKGEFLLEKQEFIDDYYEKYWDKLYNGGLQGKGSSYFHKSVEKYWSNSAPKRILEVGAGYGGHSPFLSIEEPGNTQFDALDIRVFGNRMLDVELASGNLHINWIEGSVENMPLKSSTYDRVLSTCLFHHVDDPLKSFQEIRRVAKEGAEIAIVFPTDPGMLNRFVKTFYTFRRARQVGIEHPELINALEHKNHIFALLKILKYVFREDYVSLHFRPFGFGRVNINLLVVAHITIRNSL